jgi:hypothetical protein
MWQAKRSGVREGGLPELSLAKKLELSACSAALDRLRMYGVSGRPQEWFSG